MTTLMFCPLSNGFPAVNGATACAEFGTLSPLAGAAPAGEAKARATSVPAAAVPAMETVTRLATCRMDIERLLRFVGRAMCDGNSGAGSQLAKSFLTHPAGTLKEKCLVTRTKHLAIAQPFHARHKGFT